MSILAFVVKSIFCAGLLTGYYCCFLRNKAFHQYNRFYLLGATLFSLALPFIRLPSWTIIGRPGDALITSLRVISADDWEAGFTGTAPGNFASGLFTTGNVLLLIYCTGVAWFGFSLIRSLLYIRSITRRYRPEKSDTIRFYTTNEPGTPFSFFNRIFWDQSIEHTSEEGRQVLRHERYHVFAGHSYDIIFLELVGVFCWFNPFYHLIAREIKAIHEFLADEYASQDTGAHAYAEMLVMAALHNHPVQLSNQFFQNQLKRRITMMLKNNPSNFTYLRRLMALPVMAGVCCAFAVSPKPLPGMLTRAAAPVTVVIDAGHGGVDPGVRGANGIAEKDLTLAIAKRILANSAAYGVRVILTRDQDILPGAAGSAEEGLRNRTALVQEGRADLFVSIHINQKAGAVQPAGSAGFDIYVSQQNPEFTKSRLLASAVSGEMKKTYPMADALRESNSIWVLKSTNVPAILIECGFMDDDKNFAFITDENNQAVLANNILQGIANYASNVSSTTLLHEPETELAAVQQTVRSASYPGGAAGWLKYLNGNFKFPAEAIKKEIEGTVVVEFEIDDHGKVSKISATQGPENGGLKEEAMRMIRESGDWLPAMENNRAVASVKKQPVTFKLKQ